SCLRSPAAFLVAPLFACAAIHSFRRGSAARHSSLRPATTPFQTPHLDVRGPTPHLGPERERYFLVVVDDYSKYTTLNLWPRVSRLGDSSTIFCTGSPSVASEFHVWDCLALVRDTSADKPSARTIPYVFLGFPVESPDFSFYHPLLHHFLDSCDVRVARIITLSQSHMVQQVFQQFRLQHSTTQPTPLAVDHRLTGPFPDEPFECSGPYAELVGCLMYLMTCTRLDLTFALSVLSHFFATERHRPVKWTAVVRVAKYLAIISGMWLVLGGRQPVVLAGHCASSYADDVETQSAEAEIYAGAMAAQEFRWLTFLLADLDEWPNSAPTLFADNKAMILLFR
ncbi:unnamed protein product, partial [Closterium sp. NIES-53]